jgi:hypothetical protein
MKEQKSAIKKRSLQITEPLAKKLDELKARVTIAEGQKILTETLLERWIIKDLEEFKKEK